MWKRRKKMKERRNYLEKETILFGGGERKGGKYSRRHIYCFAEEKKSRKRSGENKYIFCNRKENGGGKYSKF